MTPNVVSAYRWDAQQGHYLTPQKTLWLCAEVERCWAEIAALREERNTLGNMLQLERGQYVTRQEMLEGPPGRVALVERRE